MAPASAFSSLQECVDILESGNSPREALERLREAFSALDAKAPGGIAWGGAGRSYKSKVGDFLKKTARDTVGVKSKARAGAQGAYQQGQQALAHSQSASKLADKLAKKGDANGAVSAHNVAVKSQQSAMQGFKHTMDQANKEGDRDTADWAAKAGAVHSAVRTRHMQMGSQIRQWAVKNQKTADTSRRQAAVAQGASNKAAAAPKGNNFAGMYQDHMAKVAAGAKAKASNPAGATPFSSAPPVHAPAPSAAAPSAAADIKKPKKARKSKAVAA